MKRIQIENHRTGAYEIKIYILLLCFNDKIHILYNGYDGLTLGY